MRENAKIKTARRLRRDMTDAEKRLWYLLRGRRFSQVKFRRQHALGSFVCDFICIEHKLVIEVDGGQHAIALASDARRTAYLTKEGFTVLRFWNNDVLMNTENVLMAILQHISPDSPHPDFLTFSEEEKNIKNQLSPVNRRGDYGASLAYAV